MWWLSPNLTWRVCSKACTRTATSKPVLPNVVSAVSGLPGFDLEINTTTSFYQSPFGRRYWRQHQPCHDCGGS